MSERRDYVFASILVIAGLLVSLFLLYEHVSPSASRLCTFGSTLDCGTVNRSPYANVDGISYLLTIDLKLPLPLINISGQGAFFSFITSNAFLGLLVLVFLLFLLRAEHKHKRFPFIKKENERTWLRGITLFSAFYGLYLFLVQHYLLRTYCVFCLVFDLLLVVLTVIVWKKW
jgi:uncharacterized membrane protein